MYLSAMASLKAKATKFGHLSAQGYWHHRCRMGSIAASSLIANGSMKSDTPVQTPEYSIINESGPDFDLSTKTILSMACSIVTQNVPGRAVWGSETDRLPRQLSFGAGLSASSDAWVLKVLHDQASPPSRSANRLSLSFCSCNTETQETCGFLDIYSHHPLEAKPSNERCRRTLQQSFGYSR